MAGPEEMYGRSPAVDALGAAARFSLLSDRERQHGPFPPKAGFIQRTKELMREAPNWDGLPDEQQEALDAIVAKMGRVLYGDHRHPDHWKDIAGYAELVSRELRD